MLRAMERLWCGVVGCNARASRGIGMGEWIPAHLRSLWWTPANYYLRKPSFRVASLSHILVINRSLVKLAPVSCPHYTRLVTAARVARNSNAVATFARLPWRLPE